MVKYKVRQDLEETREIIEEVIVKGDRHEEVVLQAEYVLNSIDQDHNLLNE